MNCENCGLTVQCQASVLIPAENAFKRDERHLFSFCTEQCAVEFAFAHLPTKSTRETVTRFFNDEPISLADFTKKYLQGRKAGLISKKGVFPVLKTNDLEGAKTK